MFADQWSALAGAGFSTSLCSDAVLDGSRPLVNLEPGATVVYRGWMVTAEQYESLIRAIEECRAKPITSPEQYLGTHHLPNWYSVVSDLTPETRVFPVDADIVAELRDLNWGAYFLKDYVKSLKTGRGSIVRVPELAPAVIAEMREYRGEIEGGICARRVEEFVPNSEQRYFVLCGNCYAADSGSAIPEVVRICAERLSSKFFSVDVARRVDGTLRLVEVGDGQVSDLVGWTPTAFADMWRQAARG